MAYVVSEGEIFVFGSNQLGIHGAGAARTAYLDHGAIYYLGEGLQGNSYAIPTKDRHMRPMSLEEIRVGVMKFLDFARSWHDTKFFVTRIGCGLAGYKNTDIAPMFLGAPANCRFDPEWLAIIGNTL